jgi:type I site-specific restriction endonuclease
MALTEDRKALVETILNTLREDPSLLEEFRRLLVPEIVVFLPDLKLIAERQAALEERLTRELSAVWEAINALRAEVAELRQEVRSVAERQERMEKRQEQMEQRMERMEQRQERMEQRQERMEQRLERMEERQDRMEQRQDRMERRLQRLETDVGHLKGTVKEITYRTNFLGYFGFWVLSAEDPWRRLWEKIEEALQEGMLTQDELTDLRSADLLWLGILRRGKFAGQEVLIVAEFSWTVQREDVERALRRASLARKAGFWSLPLVAGTEWESAELKNEAIAKGVVCVENGRVDPLDWDTILTLWQPNKGT